MLEKSSFLRIRSWSKSLVSWVRQLRHSLFSHLLQPKKEVFIHALLMGSYLEQYSALEKAVKKSVAWVKLHKILLGLISRNSSSTLCQKLCHLRQTLRNFSSFSRRHFSKWDQRAMPHFKLRSITPSTTQNAVKILSSWTFPSSRLNMTFLMAPVKRCTSLNMRTSPTSTSVVSTLGRWSTLRIMNTLSIANLMRRRMQMRQEKLNSSLRDPSWPKSKKTKSGAWACSIISLAILLAAAISSLRNMLTWNWMRTLWFQARCQESRWSSSKEETNTLRRTWAHLAFKLLRLKLLTLR